MPGPGSAVMRPETRRQRAIARFPASAEELEVRITRDRVDVAAAQALRYQLFYQEMAAQPTAAMAALGRDFDHFDAVSDHLLVIDHAPPPGEVVGTYRLLRPPRLEQFQVAWNRFRFFRSRQRTPGSAPRGHAPLGAAPGRARRTTGGPQGTNPARPESGSN